VADSQDRSPLDLLCDLFVYAPLGFAFEAPKLVPELATKGRDQVATARSVGQLVLQKAGSRLAPVVGSVFGGVLTTFGLNPSPPRPASEGPSSSAEVPDLPSDDELDELAVDVDDLDELAADLDELVLDDLPEDVDDAAWADTGPAGGTATEAAEDVEAAEAPVPTDSALVDDAGGGAITTGDGTSTGARRGGEVALDSSLAALSPTGQASLVGGPSAEALTDPVAASAEEAGRVAVEREVPSAEALAIPHYDSLAASQVVPRLAALSEAELRAVRAYESAQRGRRTILNRIEQILGRPREQAD
jgi:hypothetical protein